MKTSLFCSLTAVSVMCLLNFSCQAQASKDKSSFARYYIEAHLNKTDYEILYPRTPNLGRTSPWLVSVGWRLTPRWAVQLGYAFRHNGIRDDPAYVGTTLTGQRTYSWRSSDTWTHAIPLLVRYKLFRLPNSRLRVDLLGGATFVDARYEIAGAGYVNDVLIEEGHEQDHTKQWFVTAGIGAHYPFSRHLEGVFDYGYVRNLKHAPEYVHMETTGNSWGLTKSISLGLRYRFNVGKGKQTE